MAGSSPMTSLDLQTPIMVAPMAGGPSTPELGAAVSAAGGMGWLGCAYLTPEQIVEQGERVRALTDRPFGINLFVGGWSRQVNRDEAAPMLALLAQAHARLGLPAPVVPAIGIDPFPAQLEAVLDVAPAAFSFSFGMPRTEELSRVKQQGIKVFGTATTVREAHLLAQSGVDGIIAQGDEAGGHRGSFAGAFEQSMVPMLDLVEAIGGETGLPILAAGGMMDGRDIRRALDRGASAALLGTAFLGCPEAGVSPAYRKALLEADGDPTVITRAFSGRPARGLPNAFSREVATSGTEIPRYPLQNAMTRPMRAAAAQQGEADYLSMWAGRGVARLRQMPAAELVAVLKAELQATGEMAAAE